MDAAGGACSALPSDLAAPPWTSASSSWGDLVGGSFLAPEAGGDPGGPGVTLMAELPAGQTLENREAPPACSPVLPPSSPGALAQPHSASGRSSGKTHSCSRLFWPPALHTQAPAPHTSGTHLEALPTAVSSVLDDPTCGGLVHNICAPGIRGLPSVSSTWRSLARGRCSSAKSE